MGNLSSYNSIPSPRAAMHSPTAEQSESGEAPGPIDPHGYVSDGLVQNGGSLRERKKGVPWTEDEHRMFLVGLQKLGKGDWRGIARNFVPSRTPTQVASHAQKYFLRQNNLNKRKRRSSLFDMISSSPASTACNTGDNAGSYLPELNLASSPNVSADLCLGISDEAHREAPSPPMQSWCQKFSSPQQAGMFVACQAPTNISERTKVLPLTLTFASQSSYTESNVVKASAAAASFTSSSAMSSSSSSSSLSSLCRIDEVSELSASLTLSIGPPRLLEQSAELTLKLEQPRHATMAGSTSNGSPFTNAIQVV